MHNILNQHFVRIDHISALGALSEIPAQPQLRIFTVQLIGGQTLHVKAMAEAAQKAHDKVLGLINALP
ncbi:hypothetical protein PV767_09420 [Stenotrophomonas rhizophila]|uniref:hypothetical protein n=1 Tax=Stenotrophomonas TaxID=40323 RepID=UPI003B7E845E